MPSHMPCLWILHDKSTTGATIAPRYKITIKFYAIHSKILTYIWTSDSTATLRTPTYSAKTHISTQPACVHKHTSYQESPETHFYQTGANQNGNKETDKIPTLNNSSTPMQDFQSTKESWIRRNAYLTKPTTRISPSPNLSNPSTLQHSLKDQCVTKPSFSKS